MSARSDVLLWAQRIVNKGEATPTHLLEIREVAGLDEAQAAFHKVARMAHPDLHRTSLSPEELELVTTAYARVANAYQEFRNAKMQTSRIRSPMAPPRAASPSPTAATAVKPPSNPGISPPKPLSSPGMTPPKTAHDPTSSLDAPTKPGGAAGQMTSKALVYYRKAELSLRRGDLKGAVLQLKMAIAADPLSTMLRSALTEVESEIGKSG